MPDPVSDISSDPINGTVLKLHPDTAVSKSSWKSTNIASTAEKDQRCEPQGTTRCGPYLIGRQAREAIDVQLVRRRGRIQRKPYVQP